MSHRRSEAPHWGLVAQEPTLTRLVGEGWEPLCDFLGVDVPDEPFPHTNDSAAFREMVEGHADGR